MTTVEEFMKIERALDEALSMTFPASDPVAIAPAIPVTALARHAVEEPVDS